MEDVPPLDQVSSQALTRLAAERGLTPSIVGAGEDVVRPLKRSWTRFLPYLFFGLSLFALAGMVLGVANLADGGWSIGDFVQLALMALLVLGVYQQSRSMLRLLGVTRLFRRAKPAAEPAHTVAPAGVVHFLDAVPAEELASLRPAERQRAQLAAIARKKGAHWLERVAVVSVVALAILAFLGMVFLCGYLGYVAGPWDPSLWLTVPFTALTGFGSFQIVRSARRSAFRGRPWALIQRAFRDSVRVWGSGSLVTNVLLTSTATASVAGAAIVPIVAPATTPYDLFLIDTPSGAVYRVDLATRTGFAVSARESRPVPLGLGTTGAAFKAAGDGKSLPKGSLVAVLEGERGTQAVVGYRPGQVRPVALTRLEPSLTGAQFAVGQKYLFALEPDGTLTGIDLSSGATKVIAKLSLAVGPMAYDPDAKALFVFGSNALTKVSPTTGQVLESKPVTSPNGVRVCGVARGNKGTLWLTDAATGKVFTVAPNKKDVKQFAAAGELPSAPCAIALALRR